jgi:hypothetical protein
MRSLRPVTHPRGGETGATTISSYRYVIHGYDGSCDTELARVLMRMRGVSQRSEAVR